MSNEVINPYQTFFDDDGIPLANGTISFLVNTQTALGTIFSDEALTVAQANPYPLDAYGRIKGDVKYTGLRTLLIKTDLGATVRTLDNIATVFDPDTLDLDFVKNFATLAAAVADVDLQADDSLNLKERTTGNGGGAMWDVALSSTVTENTYNIVQCTGVGTLSLVLRVGNECIGEQFGVVGDVVTDNAGALQAAFDYAENNTAGLVTLGAGSFRFLTAIEVPFNGALQGIGYNTRLTPEGINAFNFIDSGIPSARTPWKDFWIDGDDTVGSIAFNVTVDDGGATKAIKGLLFSNVFVQDFEEAWRFTGVWNCTLFKCDTSDVWKAVNCIDRNVHIVLDSCNLVRGATVAGYSGDCVGFLQQIGGFALRTEDIQIKNTLIFGFDIGVKFGNVLFSSIEGSDIDFCVQTGIQIVNVQGSCSIKSTWVFTAGDNGILVSSIGTASNDQLLISGCNIERQTQGTLAGVIGINIGTGQANTSVENNHINKFHFAAKLESPKTRYVGNWDTDTNSHSLQFADTAIDCFVYDNVFEGTVDRTANRPNTNFGENEGVLTKKYIQVVMDAGVTSQVFTWASLGLDDGINNASISAFMNNPAAASMGNVRAVATQTQVTVYRDTALGALAGLDMQIVSK